MWWPREAIVIPAVDEQANAEGYDRCEELMGDAGLEPAEPDPKFKMPMRLASRKERANWAGPGFRITGATFVKSHFPANSAPISALALTIVSTSSARVRKFVMHALRAERPSRNRALEIMATPRPSISSITVA